MTEVTEITEVTEVTEVIEATSPVRLCPSHPCASPELLEAAAAALQRVNPLCPQLGRFGSPGEQRPPPAGAPSIIHGPVCSGRSQQPLPPRPAAVAALW